MLYATFIHDMMLMCVLHVNFAVSSNAPMLQQQAQTGNLALSRPRSRGKLPRTFTQPVTSRASSKGKLPRMLRPLSAMRGHLTMAREVSWVRAVSTAMPLLVMAPQSPSARACRPVRSAMAASACRPMSKLVLWLKDAMKCW